MVYLKYFSNLLYLNVFLPVAFFGKSYFLFLKYLRGFLVMSNTDARLLVNLRVSVHILEKGLTMPRTRLGFGKSRCMELVRLLNICQARELSRTEEYIMAMNLISEYLEFHKAKGYQLDTSLKKLLMDILEPDLVDGRKQIGLDRENFFKYAQSDFELFSKSRRSVRNFSRRCDQDLFRRAVSLANTAPSACNRQAHKVHVVSDSVKIAAILKIQGGANGFGHTIPQIGVLTVDYKCLGRFEEHDGYFNSGLYASSLMYSMHYYEIGSVFLNWSSTLRQERALRELITLSPTETVTVLFAFGVPEDYLRLCRSEKKSLNNTLIEL